MEAEEQPIDATQEHLTKMESEFRATQPAEPRSLPAALQARLAKRGILPQATIAAPPAITHPKKPAAAPPKPLPAPADLQPGWRCALDPEHERVFYYNLSTGVRTWIKPSTGPPLPPGWIEVQDANTGGSYFCSVRVGQSQWHHPSIVGGAAVGVAPRPMAHSGAASAAFIPSQSFVGPRPGYVFKRGPQGVGYYADQPGAAPVEQRPVQGAQGGRSFGRRRGGDNNDGELDPMDPAAYSDAPRGGWAQGLEGARAKAN